MRCRITFCAMLVAIGTFADAPAPAGRSGLKTPLSPMVPLYHHWDLTAAPKRVREAAKPENGARSVQFTLTLLADLDAKFKVLRWGDIWEKPGATPGAKKEHGFVPMNEAIRAQYLVWLTNAFATAVSEKLGIAVLCHANAGGTIQEWRNYYDFDPTEKLEGYSYEDAMTRLVLEALEASVPADWPVELTLEGEMGCTLFSHPDAWLQVLERAKSRGKLKNLRVGISANHDNVRAKYEPDPKQKSDMNALIRAADYVGISCYAKVSVPPTAADFTATLDRFAAEFVAVGCPIPDGKEIHFSELGLGGGGRRPEKNSQLTVPSPTVEGMATAAFFGTGEVAKNPWALETHRAFRRQWHRAALDFLATQPARWPVTSAYLWSQGSWDVHGFTQPVFRDEEIVKMIREHNATQATAQQK